MIDAEILSEDDHVELIDGELFKFRVLVDGLSTPFRFSPKRVSQLVDLGIVSADDAECLPTGENPPDMSRDPQHDATIDLIIDVLRDVLPRGWRCRGQSAVTLGTGEPEPDLAVVRGSARDFGNRHPNSGDIAVVIEVAYHTLRNDRTRKLRTYARNGVAVYWIVDVKGRQVEVHTDPTQPPNGESFYATRTVVTIDQAVPLIIEGRDLGPIPASQLFL
jgi:hypothetical protein